jgi:hypothetical protein
MRPARIASLLALAALLATGCAEEPRPPAEPAPAAQAPPPATLAIQAPGTDPVTASGANGELRARTDVTGTATPGEFVQVSADCDEDDCRTGARADAAGNWSARVLLVGAGDRRANVRLVVQSGAQVALGLARLETPKPRRTRARPKTAAKPRRKAPAASAATTPALPTSGSSTASASRIVMVGDSLAVGTKAPLASALPGWDVTTDGRTGRPLAEGMGIIRTLASAPPVLAVSLFTNDGPGSVAALENAVRETITLQSGRGCVIWATIVRPPVGGQTYDNANAALARLAAANPGVMRIVPWAAQVAAHPEWLAADGVHATPAGYAARAQLYAAAARTCS